MALHKLYHVALNVSDLDRSAKFYEEIVGFQIRRRLPFAVFLTCGTHDHDLVVFRMGDGKPPASDGSHDDSPMSLFTHRSDFNHAAFLTDDVEGVRAVYRRLLKSGVEKIQPVDHGHVRSIYFSDPDGHTIEVGYEVPEHADEHVLELKTWDVEGVDAS